MAKTHKPSFWDNPLNQKRLERLAKKKLTATEIAAELAPIAAKLGFNVTRNSVIGRSHRTGVRLGYPEKMKKVQDANGKLLAEWNKLPENQEYRERRLREWHQSLENRMYLYSLRLGRMEMATKEHKWNT